jgi:hypothetical protein
MIPLDVRLNNFVGALEFAADEEMQRSVWIDKVSGLTSIISVGEFYCQFFDDNDMAEFVKNEMIDAPLSDVQKNAILQFCAALEPVEKLQSYRDDDDCRILESPEWKAVVQCARRTLPLFAT